jgi:hypothetical protein
VNARRVKPGVQAEDCSWWGDIPHCPNSNVLR